MGKFASFHFISIFCFSLSPFSLVRSVCSVRGRGPATNPRYTSLHTETVEMVKWHGNRRVKRLGKAGDVRTLDERL